MSATIKGKVTHILRKETVGQNNKEKQTFVIKTEGQYPSDVAFEAWGNTLQYVEKLKVGDTVEVSYDVQSREHNGRWFTTAKAYKIMAVGGGAASGEPTSKSTFGNYEEDTLPF